MELLEEDALEGLPPSEKKRHKRRKVYEYLKEQEEGATVTEIEKDLPFSRKTITKYLDTLDAKRKIYAVSGRGNSIIYKTNGTAFHPLKEFNVNGEGKKYAIKLLKQPTRDEIFLQEKEKGEDSVWEDKGAITIPVDELTKLIAVLEKAQSELGEHQFEEVNH